MAKAGENYPSSSIPSATATGLPAYSNQPPPPPLQVQGAAPPLGQWTTGLCDCGDDAGNCCMTFFCPCVTFGQVAEIVDKGSTSCGASGALYALICSVTGCQCIYSCFYRSKLRQQYNLPDSPCNDCLVHCFCEGCALCQEYRELKNRGFNMDIGWQGNMDMRAGAGGMMNFAPPVHGGMTR